MAFAAKGKYVHMAEPAHEGAVKPFAMLASMAVLGRIKQAADGLKAAFACGGSVKCSQPIQIVFREGSTSSQVQSSMAQSSLHERCRLSHTLYCRITCDQLLNVVYTTEPNAATMACARYSMSDCSTVCFIL